jgi:hypothetical protein
MSLKLFNFVEGNLVINRHEILAVDSFRTIVTRTQDKNLAFKELGFVYLVADYDSPFNKQGKSTKDAMKLAIDKVALPRTWTPDTVVLKAIKDYKDLNDNIAKELIDELLKIFNNYSKIIRKVGKSIDLLLDNDAALTKTQASELIDLSSAVIGISKQVPNEVKNLKDALVELNKNVDRENYDTLRGSDETIPDSADPDRDW